jgi:hypothetical protein
LRALHRWVCWRSEQGRKVPYNAKISNDRASSTDPTTWASFEEAQVAYLERQGESDAYSGVGFVLNGDGLAGIDIDHCVADGATNPAAIALLDSLGAAYIEVSPSGTGLRAFGYASKLDSGCKGTYNNLAVELYSTGRYLTLTGKAIKAGAIGPLVGFAELAQHIRSDRKVDPDTGEILPLAPDERHSALIQRVLSGDVYHDSLRDLAASLIATNMTPGAAVNHLYALMDASAAPKDLRWQQRRAEIPDLVTSASAKFAPVNFSAVVERAQASNAPHYKLLTGADLAALPPLKWCVRGVLPAQGLAALYGPSGSGKSFLALDLFTAIAEGRPWFGHRVELRPVVYVALEGEGGIKVRVQAWEQFHARALPDAVRLVLQPFKLTDPKDVAELGSVIVSKGGAGAVIILDTLNRAAPTSDENSSKDMGEILEGAKRLQGLTGGLVVLVHHTGKDPSRGMRGHSSMFAALDASIEVSREGDDRAWSVAKSKDGQDGLSHPFRLNVVQLGRDEFGDLITSCVCAAVTQVDAQRRKQLTHRQQEGLDSLCRAALELGGGIQDGTHVSVNLEAWRAEFYCTSTADGQDAKRTAFNRVRTDLAKLGHVTVENDEYIISETNPALMAHRISVKNGRGKKANARTNANEGEQCSDQPPE